MHAGLGGKGLDGRSCTATDDMKCHPWMAGTQQRQNLCGKPLHGIHVGPVIHGPGEHQRLFLG